MENGLIFESVRRVISEIGTPNENNQRILNRIPGSNELAVARRSSGEYEIFIIGSKIHSKRSAISQNLTFDKWQIENVGEYFDANALTLPQGEQFDAIASLIFVEFSRQDESLSIQEKFTLIEPLIDLFVRKQVLDESEAIGLIGELIFLKTLLLNSSPNEFHKVLNGWEGYTHNSRDFKYEDLSIEVKTTRHTESHHEINSVNQIEVSRDVFNMPTEKLYLLSLGLCKATGESLRTSISLESIYEEIIKIFSINDIEFNLLNDKFNNMVKKYGVSKTRHYDHSEMKDSIVASTSWNIMFNRMYDMDDVNLSLPTKDKLSEFNHTSLNSFKFTIELPRRVTGDLNPKNDLVEFAIKLLKKISNK